MNVPTIEMDEDEAAEKRDEYAAALESHEDPEHRRLADGYEQLAKGRSLLSLRQVFESCPGDAKNRPKLAIARADRLGVRWSPNQFSTSYAQRRGPTSPSTIVAIAWPHNNSDWGYALLPLIPPKIKGRRDLAKYFVLWEVEKWADRPEHVMPDRDPFLLERVDDDIFAIVAQWDLTPLEQAILAARSLTR